MNMSFGMRSKDSARSVEDACEQVRNKSDFALIAGIGVAVVGHGLAAGVIEATIVSLGIASRKLGAAARRVAEDPPRFDYAYATRPMRKFSYHGLPLPEDEVAKFASAYTDGLLSAAVNLETMVRAFEKAQGALMDVEGRGEGATPERRDPQRYLYERLEETERFKFEANRNLREVSGLASLLEGSLRPRLSGRSVDLARREGTPSRAPRSIPEMLSQEALVLLYRSGIPINEVAKVVPSRGRDTEGSFEDLVEAIGYQAREVSRFAQTLGEWDPNLR